MHLRLKKISAKSAFMVALTLYGIIGLMVGVVLAVVSQMEVPEGTEANFLSALGLWSILVVPLVYGLVGGLTAAVSASLYNAAASVAGGLRVELHGLPNADVSTMEGKEEG